MKLTWKSEGLSLAMLAAMLILAALAWTSAPDRIPVHWGLSGQPDRFGGRFEGLLAEPLVAIGVYLLLILLPRIDPRRAHYDAFSGPYAILRTGIVAFMFAVHLMILLWIRGRAIDPRTFFPISMGVLFLVLGNYLPKLKSNWFVGVRTPWTLSSEFAWRRTHRLAGWLFVASGAFVIILALVRPGSGLVAILGAVIPSAVISVVYSYFAWRRDPARVVGSDPGA